MFEQWVVFLRRRFYSKFVGLTLLHFYVSAIFVAGGQRLATEVADVKSLRFVHAVWRHGDRTPSVLIPSDVDNNITTWKLGLGELTSKGLAQQFCLGKFLRKRYDGFLQREYSPFEIYYRSSDYNRTLTSAQANAAGLFPANGSEQFLPNLKWRPIPVHTIPKYLDKILFDVVYCPYADKEELRIYSSDEVRAIEEKNAQFLKFLGEKSGLGQIPLRNMWDLFDPLNSEYNHQDEHKLPEWVNETVRREIWRLYDLSSYFLYGSDLITRLRGGPLFVEILNRMKNWVANISDSREKFYAYSAHDTSMAGILSAFGVRPTVFPRYATVVLIELHESNDGYFVKLFHKNETDGTDLWEYDIPDCARPCGLSDLEKARSFIIPRNWDEECGLYNATGLLSFDHRFYIFIIGILTVICMALLCEVVVLCLRQNRANGGGDRNGVYRPKTIVTSSSPSKFLLEMDEEEEEDDDSY